MEQQPGSNGPERHVPSVAATDRLREELRREVGSYAQAVDRDLDVLALLDAEGNPDEAVEVLQAHIARLEALQARVQLAVSGAVAEREAEGVIDRALGVPPPPPPAPLPAPGPEPMPEEVGTAAGGRAMPLRRSVVALVAVVALGTIVLGRPAPMVEEGLLTAVEIASEQASIAAAAAGTGDIDAAADLEARSAALEAAIDDLPADALATDQVRAQVTTALAGHRDQLLSLVGVVAAAPGLLAEVEQLAASLGIALPPAAATSVEPLPLPATSLPLPDQPLPDPRSEDPTVVGPTEAGPGPAAPGQDSTTPDAADPAATPGPADPGPSPEEPAGQPEDLDLDLNGDGEQSLGLDPDGLG